MGKTQVCTTRQNRQGPPMGDGRCTRVRTLEIERLEFYLVSDPVLRSGSKDV